VNVSGFVKIYPEGKVILQRLTCLEWELDKKWFW